MPPRLRFVRRARPAACLDTARRGGRVGGPQARSRRRRDEKTRLTRRGARCTSGPNVGRCGPDLGLGTRATTRHGHARGKRIETETVASQAWCAQKCVCCYVLAHCCPMSPTCCRKQRARPRTQRGTQRQRKRDSMNHRAQLQDAQGPRTLYPPSASTCRCLWWLSGQVLGRCCRVERVSRVAQRHECPSICALVPQFLERFNHHD